MAAAGATGLYGIVAEFTSADDIMRAAAATHAAGYRAAEAYTPFPVEGLSDLLGFKHSRLPAVFLIAGIIGAFTGFFMCYYAFVVSWPIIVGGKPYNSWPAWIPITFELTVLFSACAGGIGMLILNGLPRLHHPIFDAPGFERASRDRFFLCIEAEDPMFEVDAVTRFLKQLNPLAVSPVPAESPSARQSRVLPLRMPILLLLMLMPAALLLAGCEPNSDLANEPRYSTYAASDFFANGTSARPIPVGTVDRTGGNHGKGASSMGHVGSWADALPPQTPWPFKITPADLQRGEQLFEINCAPCHGRTGEGNGMIVQRGFPAPPSYHSARLRHAPPAYFVDVITHGIGAMFSYSDRVAPDDRWRIAAYIRALQLSQRAPRDVLSAEDLQAVRTAPVATPEHIPTPGKIGSQLELGPRGGTPQPGSFGPGAGAEEVVR